ncbi:hypothetical protein AAC387_Pa07g0280 [Persea americana]
MKPQDETSLSSQAVAFWSFTRTHSLSEGTFCFEGLSSIQMSLYLGNKYLYIVRCGLCFLYRDRLWCSNLFRHWT